MFALLKALLGALLAAMKLLKTWRFANSSQFCIGQRRGHGYSAVLITLIERMPAEIRGGVGDRERARQAPP